MGHMLRRNILPEHVSEGKMWREDKEEEVSSEMSYTNLGKWEDIVSRKK